MNRNAVGPSLTRGLIHWIPPWRTVSSSNRNRTCVTEIHDLVIWYGRKGVRAMCLVGYHSVIGSKVAEVRWTGGEGESVPPKCNKHQIKEFSAMGQQFPEELCTSYYCTQCHSSSLIQGTGIN